MSSSSRTPASSSSPKKRSAPLRVKPIRIQRGHHDESLRQARADPPLLPKVGKVEQLVGRGEQIPTTAFVAGRRQQSLLQPGVALGAAVTQGHDRLRPRWHSGAAHQ